MKLKNVMLVCCMTLGLALTGCGLFNPKGLPNLEEVPEVRLDDLSPEMESKEEPEDKSEEISGSEEESEEVILMDEKEMAMKAYKELLVSAPGIDNHQDVLMDAAFGKDENYEIFGEHLDTFGIYDINEDGMPELIAERLINFRWIEVYVYSFVDGEMVLCGMIDECSVANGSYYTYICEENHIHSVWSGTNPLGDAETEDTAYALEIANLTIVDCNVNESENATFLYDFMVNNDEEGLNAYFQ